MAVRVFIVLPDLSENKASAISSLPSNNRVNVLVSYTVTRWKPGVLPRLRRLRESRRIGEVMLDSGAYHLMRLGEKVNILEYAEFIDHTSELWDYVVAPDVPGDQEATLSRTLEFMNVFDGIFIPVLQGDKPRDYVLFFEKLDSLGILERAPRVMGVPLVGVGGLDGVKKRVGFVASVLDLLNGYSVKLHVFGVGARVLRGLRKRGLLDMVYSIDSSGWLAEIQWRRRTVYNASSIVEANARAIMGYLERIRGAVVG